jgi:hypothetical protein
MSSVNKVMQPQELQGVMQKFQEESMRMEMADEMSTWNGKKCILDVHKNLGASNTLLLSFFLPQ